ncbi:MAG: GDP-mannose 4,6-dehydratase [Nitrospirae bacterium]|nr:GDP-mannose 4,6-dehydratase [Nitrospirota bacterium]
MFKNKRILITGGSGFIASHLTKRLLNEGADVTIITKYNSVFENIRLSSVWDDIRVIEADLRNIDSLKQVKDLKPQIIYHMSAYNHVGDSFLHVSEALTCNSNATANLFGAYKEFERFVYISTSEVYGYQTSVPFTETMTPFPISPYSVGKYSGELYSKMMHHVYNLPIVIVRPFNTFGPYQSPRAVIGEMMIKCLEGKEIKATEGKQTREFNYVENIVDGLLAAGIADKAIGEIINICAGCEISIKELITLIHKLTESSSELKFGAIPYRPTEIWRMYGDNTKSKEILKWSPKLTFEEGLKESIEWYRGFIKVYKDKKSDFYLLNR